MKRQGKSVLVSKEQMLNVSMMAQEHAILKQFYGVMADYYTQCGGAGHQKMSLLNYIKINLFDARARMERLVNGANYFDAGLTDMYIKLRAFPIENSERKAGNGSARVGI